MARHGIPVLVLLLALLVAAPVRAGQEVFEIEPLKDGDLNHFEAKGEWKLDTKMDDLFTVLLHERAKEDATLRYRMRDFQFGFRVSMLVQGGSKYKNLECFLVPEGGEWIPVPFSSRHLSKSDWHEFALTWEGGRAYVTVDDEKGDPVPAPEDRRYTFAFKLPKRGEAMFKRLKILYLVVTKPQMDPEADFVRIFDGKTLDGWRQFPEGTTSAKLEDQRIEINVPESQERHTELVYGDGIFANFTMRFRCAQGAHNLILFGRPGTQDGSQAAVYTAIDGYFTGDKDWNDVEWVVDGLQVTLNVNGNRVWTQTAQNQSPIRPNFIVGRGGKATIRDIRVKGQNQAPGASWGRYVQESGGQVGIGGGGPAAGGGGESPREGPLEGSRMEGTKELFNGSDLADWRCAPADCWTAVDGKIVGITLDRPNPAELLYGKLVFSDYRLVFKVQRGTKGAKFIARGYMPKEGGPKTVVLDIRPEWLGEAEWTEFEAEAWGTKLVLKVAGSEVGTFGVPEDAGFIGWVIEKDSAIGLKDIVWHRPERR